MPCVRPGWAALFFVTVNQVLVRLWARVTDIDRWSLDHGLIKVPSFGRMSDRELLLVRLNGDHSG